MNVKTNERIEGDIIMANYMMSLLQVKNQNLSELDLICVRLLDMLKVKSPHIYNHSMQVAQYAESIATCMGLPLTEIAQIKYAALLHDIGMLMLPNQLLNSYPYLNKQEYARYKRHVSAGASMIENYPCTQQIIPYIMYHHEHWDGSGYPKHLKRDNIPLGARIIAVADYYDSTVNPATEYWAKSKNDARRELLAASGILYDPEVVKAFIEILS